MEKQKDAVTASFFHKGLQGRKRSGWAPVSGRDVPDYEAARANAIAFYGYNNPSLRELGAGYIESFGDFVVG